MNDGTSVNTKTTLKKETPLHKAAQYGNISTSLLLLLNGADPRALGIVFDCAALVSLYPTLKLLKLLIF